MAANDLALQFTDIQKTVAIELGWARDPDNFTDQQDDDLDILIKDGFRQFYYPPPLAGERKAHNWSFLYPEAEIELTASYTTGTITVSSGVVTGSGTTFPSWSANGGYLWYTGTDGKDKGLEITSYTNGTTIGVGSSSDNDAAAGTTFTIRRHYYELPDDFGGMASDSFAYRRDEQWHLPDVKVVGDSDLRQMDRESNGEIYPRYAAVTPITPVEHASNAVSSRWRVRFYPLAEQTYYLTYRYRVIPPTLDDANSATRKYTYAGAEYADCLMASIVDKAYQRFRDSMEYHPIFLERLHAAIAHDRRNHTVSNFGYGPASTGKHSGTYEDALSRFRRNTPHSNITLNFS